MLSLATTAVYIVFYYSPVLLTCTAAVYYCPTIFPSIIFLYYSLSLLPYNILFLLSNLLYAISQNTT